MFGFPSHLGHHRALGRISHGASQVVVVAKTLPANAGDIRGMGSITGSGRSPEGENGNQ